MGSKNYVLGLLCLAVAACGAREDVARGKAIYDMNCAICHGADGRGGGGANVAGLSKTPVDLTVLSLAGGSFPTAQMVAILRGYEEGDHAGRRMRPFTDLSSDNMRRLRLASGRVLVPHPQADLLAYLRSLQRP